MEPLTKRQKISMDIKDIAKAIKQQLKKEFPLCAFSVQIERYSMGQNMTIALMKTPFEAFNKNYTQDKNGNVYNEKDFQYCQLNHYVAIDKFTDGYNNGHYLTEDAYKVLKRACELVNYYNYDDSDIQTDYFDVNFYVHLAIGKWDKPYQKI